MLSELKSFDDAKAYARELFARGSRTPEPWMVRTADHIVAPALLLAARRGQDLDTALRWADRWNELGFLDVQLGLQAFGELPALEAWNQVRAEVMLAQLPRSRREDS